MKTAKLVIGILSMVLFLVIVLQSCIVGVGNVLVENDEISGSAGVFLAICMLVAGIVGVATRKHFAGGIVAGSFYLVGALIGACNYGTYSALLIWSILSACFGVTFILGTILAKVSEKKKSAPAEEQQQ